MIIQQRNILRIVSYVCPTKTSRKALNYLLCKGGVLQEDLFSILIRFRKHIYPLIADIKQMFRMIEIKPSQYRFLKILWKDSKSSPIKIHQLLTVTHVTTCFPYFSNRT